jgi:hypothetical protein
MSTDTQRVMWGSAHWFRGDGWRGPILIAESCADRFAARRDWTHSYHGYVVLPVPAVPSCDGDDLD